MLGAGALTSVTMAGFHYSGGFRGYKKDLVHAPGEDDADLKEKNKTEYRRPLSEMIADLGEGRGEWDLSNHYCQAQANALRYLCPWVRGEEAPTVTGQVRRRCWRGARIEGLKRGFLTANIPPHRSGQLPARVHIHNNVNHLRRIRVFNFQSGIALPAQYRLPFVRHPKRLSEHLNIGALQQLAFPLYVLDSG